MKHLGEKTTHDDCEGRAVCVGDIIELTKAGSGQVFTGQVVPRFSGFSVAVKGEDGRICNYIGSGTWKPTYRIRTVTPYDQIPGLVFTPDESIRRPPVQEKKDPATAFKETRRKAREIANLTRSESVRVEADITSFSDEALAEELRRRGFSGDLERHTTLSV